MKSTGGMTDESEHALFVYEVRFSMSDAAATWRQRRLFLARADPKSLNMRRVGRVRVNTQHPPTLRLIPFDHSRMGCGGG
jgi:hypothetical protein